MIVSVAYFSLFFLLFFVLLALLLFNAKPAEVYLATQPKVSILIAARNEEHTILRCLTAIEALNYPKNKLEVIIGDDASTDSTRAVIDAFIKDKPAFTCVSITENIGKARGKANVLAHLAKLATSDYFFFTDADIAVPGNWIQAMLAAVQGKVGVVTGLTTITGKSLFARLQSIDWLYSLGLVQVVSDLNLPVTAMGNNMLILREAYTSVGGFESIDFSVTEDIAIFNKILQQGYGFRNLYNANVLAFSTPAGTVLDFMNQRKRWMRGSMHLPLYMGIIFILHAAYYPVLLPFVMYTSLAAVLAIFALKWLLQSIYLYICLRRLGRRVPWWLYILFEFYLIVSAVVLIIYFFLPTKINWKGRKF
jgi:cellulose synthase/poly-beta-1,6-N-acetylglucosamine synthase-like glycosyltransferase